MRKNPQDFRDGVILVTVEELAAMGAPQEMIAILSMVIEAHVQDGDTLKRPDTSEEDI